MKKKSNSLVFSFSLILTMSMYISANPASDKAVGHIKLKSNLDRPQDGFCIDVVGFSPYERLDLPLIAHNCKPGLYKDQALSVLENGRLFLPAFNKCVTAIAPYTRALPGTALMARDCGEHSDFLETDKLQRFVWNEQGEVSLKGSDLCIAVGDKSDQTSAASHRWRALFLQTCDKVESQYSRWKFVPK